MDTENYESYVKNKEEDFENMCTRCGECCGSLDDPCMQLLSSDNGTFICRDYTNRIGPQKTLSGQTFTCVPITDHIRAGSLRPTCAYRNKKCHN